MKDADSIDIGTVTNLLQLCVDRASKVVPHLRVDLTCPTDEYSLGLLLAVIDYGRSVITLANGKAYPAISIITRSCIEAYVDLVNICDHPLYWQHLFAVDTAEWKAFYDAAKRGDNPSLTAFAEDSSVEEGRKLYARQSQAVDASKIQSLRVKQRFERAEMMHEYEAAYVLLCAVAHNNVSNLQSRYFFVDGERLGLRQGGNEYPRPLRYELP